MCGCVVVFVCLCVSVCYVFVCVVFVCFVFVFCVLHNVMLRAIFV